jgi:hypothetical protein
VSVSARPVRAVLVGCLWGAVALCVLSCGPTRFPDVVVKPASEYTLSREVEGFIVSIDPFLDRRRVMNAFGFDLLRRGVVPVLIVAENRSPDTGFYLQKEHCYLGGQTESTIRDEQQAGDYGMHFGTVTGIMLVSPALGILALGIDGDAAIRDHKTRQNLVNKELREKTLFPGESQHGFLYFRCDSPADIESVGSVTLGVLNLETYERLWINVPIKDR